MRTEMTLETKIGQLLMASLDGMVLDAASEQFIRDHAIGNIIHFGNNVRDPEQARAFNAALRECVSARCGIPPLIAIDHEGGRVMRFSEGVTRFPSAMAVGVAGDEGLAEAAGRAMGVELAYMGFQVNMAPVLDVNTNLRNPVIGTRAFGETPDAVARFGVAVMRGLESAGIIAAGKHFPGHGDTALDSHFSLPCVNKPLEALERMELVPFAEAIRAGMRGVMTSHILYPAIEPDRVPATLSARVLTGLLRGRMEFSGLIITDGMHMRAIAAHFGIERGCVEAIKAGADMLCIGTAGAGRGEAQASCFRALVAAVQSGEIAMARVDDAVSRVLSCKRTVCAQNARVPDYIQHRHIARTIADRSVRWVTDHKNGSLGRALFRSAEAPFSRMGVTEGDWRTRSFAAWAGALWKGAHAGTLAEADTVVIGLPSVDGSDAQIDWLREALAAGKRAIAVLTGVPYGAEALPEGVEALCLYGLTEPSLEAMAALLYALS